MKKISLLFATMAATLAFTACEDNKDHHPVIDPVPADAVADFLNVPSSTNMTVVISNETKGESQHMTCSQPDFGYTASVRYQVEIALNEDFETPAVEGQPASVVLDTPFFDASQVNPSNEEIATAVCKMLDIKGEDQLPTPAQDLYARVRASVNGAGNIGAISTLSYLSNTVKLCKISVSYLAVVVPGLPTGIYIRGGVNDWGALPEWEFLTTGEANVYEIEMTPAVIEKDSEFKIADSSWAAPNLGLGADPFEIGKPYALNGGDNPGNIVMPADFIGRVTLTKKGDSYTVLFEPTEPDTPGNPTGVFLRGGMNGWNADASWEFVTSSIKGISVMEGVQIAAGTEFKVADAEWGSINLGGAAGEEFVIGEPFKLVSGGDNILMTDDFYGNVSFQSKGGSYYVTFVEAEL